MQLHVKAVFGIVGGYISYALGGWDIMLNTLVALVFLDYATGVFAAAYKQEISSYRGFKGIIKKIMIFFVIALSSLLDKVFNDEIVRNISVIFYISNEGISILENVVKCDVPVPQKLKDILKIMRKKENEDEENLGGEIDEDD